MHGLYSKKYLSLHKMTSAAATIGEDRRISMKKYELDQILGNNNPYDLSNESNGNNSQFFHYRGDKYPLSTLQEVWYQCGHSPEVQSKPSLQ